MAALQTTVQALEVLSVLEDSAIEVRIVPAAAGPGAFLAHPSNCLGMRQQGIVHVGH